MPSWTRVKAPLTCCLRHRHPTDYLGARAGGEVDLDVNGWGDHAKHKAVSDNLGQMLPLSPISQGACLRKASIFEEISMLRRPVQLLQHPWGPGPFAATVERFTLL